MKTFVIEIADDNFVRILEVTREEIYAGPGKDYAYYRGAGSEGPAPVDYGFSADDRFYTRFQAWLRDLTAPKPCEATVVRHCEDSGHLCGKQCAPGHSLCPDHLSEVGQ